MLKPDAFVGIASVIAACAGLVTAVGVIITTWLTHRHGRVLKQVERQGNSVSLELKRTNMVYSRRLAVATNQGADIAIADDAEKVYSEAKAAAERDGNSEPKP